LEGIYVSKWQKNYGKLIHNIPVVYSDGKQVEKTSQFRDIDSLISEDGYFTKHIWSRIEMVKVFMGKKLFTGKMNPELNKKNNEMLSMECSTKVSK